MQKMKKYLHLYKKNHNQQVNLNNKVYLFQKLLLINRVSLVSKITLAEMIHPLLDQQILRLHFKNLLLNKIRASNQEVLHNVNKLYFREQQNQPQDI